MELVLSWKGPIRSHDQSFKPMVLMLIEPGGGFLQKAGGLFRDGRRELLWRSHQPMARTAPGRAKPGLERSRGSGAWDWPQPVAALGNAWRAIRADALIIRGML